MAALLPVFLTRPIRTLTIAFCCIAALAAAGLNAEKYLHQTSLSIAGTESARADAQLRHYFGDSTSFAILLKGPERDLNRQGRMLVRALEAPPAVTAISPWEPGAPGELRPSRRSAVILISFRVGIDKAASKVVPWLNSFLGAHVSPPVRATQSGYATISRALQDELVKAAAQGEMLALPVLLIVLLLVFRSPIAAAIPLVFGAATVAASDGVLAIAANWMSIDAFALTASSMVGLALGVDYALLMVSRFREELAGGTSPLEAARATRRTAGRTITFAGSALLLSMVTAALLLPGTLLVSLAGAVVVVTGLSVAFGVLVVPALLVVIGHRIDRWAIGRRRKGGGLFTAVDSVLRRPGVTAALALTVLAVLSLPVVELKTGPPSFEQLPEHNRSREDAESIEGAVGPGWLTPYVVIASGDGRPIVSPHDLAALHKWQQVTEQDDLVQAVFGPGSISDRIAPLRRFGDQLLAQGKPDSQFAQLQQLGSRLDQAEGGVTRLRKGISQMTYGSGLLTTGVGRVSHGADELDRYLSDLAAEGDSSRALARLTAGASRVRNGQRRVALGALALKLDLGDLLPRFRHGTLLSLGTLQRELVKASEVVPGAETGAARAEEQLGVGLLELQRVSEPPNDPHYAAAVAAVKAAADAVGANSGPDQARSLSGELESLSSSLAGATERAIQVRTTSQAGVSALNESASGAAQLSRGASRLAQAGNRLEAGTNQIDRSAKALAAQLPKLAGGAHALSDGTTSLLAGNESLTHSLAEAYSLSSPLAPALRRAASRATTGGAKLLRQTRRLKSLSPRIFDSGYFALSALDGTRDPTRSQIRQILNLGQGGEAVRFFVIPKKESTSLESRLRDSASELAHETGGTAGVTGGFSVVHDYATATTNRIPIVIAAISVVTFLVLLIVLRSILVCALAVALNLLSTAVAFGTLALLSRMPAWFPIGHWEYIDAVASVAIYSLMFGLSIDYAVFLLMRVREEFDRTGDHAAAVSLGLRHTGRIITGAAVIMLAVFAAFAASSLSVVSQLGIGSAVAIFIDATLIRLILLPAILLIVGERVWWLPPALARVLPSGPPSVT